MPGSAPLLRLADYPSRAGDLIRYGDMDRQDHVNNAVFLTYLETGRVALFRDPNAGLQIAGASFVVARIEIDFRRELTWPGTVEIGTGVAAIGNRSFTLAQAVFCSDDCAATARVVIVAIDLVSRKAQPLPAPVVARLEALRVVAGRE